ncbi:MAG: helix-hairpin-helix domain-containing protein [Candidatus Erginobacter occultus]|nr:helix-hairpin-helix domain-containing protein [Candidatus Erginobacter occultus]
MRTSTVQPSPRRRRNLFARLTRREWAILSVLAAALLCGAVGGTVEIIRGQREATRAPVALYRELRQALPDPEFAAQPVNGSERTTEHLRRLVYLTRPPFSGEAEVETAEDGWIFFPRDYYTTININRAGFDELVSLPGIGPVAAWRIINYRRRFVGFSRIKALMRVKGIGEKTLKSLEGEIRLY